MDIEDLRSNWETFGRTIPLRSILWRKEPWESEEFFATGRGAISHSMNQLAEFGIRPAGRALDFGCGIGRLTQALGEYFDEVIGVDVAASMIDQARERNRLGDRCRYVVNARDDLSQFDDESFDFVYSQIVLQHVGSDLARAYMREFVRVLRRGGVAMFQLPSQFVPPAVLPPSGFRAQIEMTTTESTADGLRLQCGTPMSMSLRIRNESAEVWLPTHRLAIGGRWRQEEGGLLEDGFRTAIVEGVAQNESVDVDAEATVPLEPGVYVLELDVIQEGVAWFGDHGSGTLSLSIEAIESNPSSEVLPAQEQGNPTPDDLIPHMEMQAVERSEVIDLLQSSGAEVVAVLDDTSAGSEWTSFFYVARRRPKSLEPRRLRRLHHVLRKER